MNSAQTQHTYTGSLDPNSSATQFGKPPVSDSRAGQSISSTKPNDIINHCFTSTEFPEQTSGKVRRSRVEHRSAAEMTAELDREPASGLRPQLWLHHMCTLRTSSTMLERRVDVDIFVLFLILKQCFKSFTLKNDVCCNYLIKALYQFSAGKERNMSGMACPFYRWEQQGTCFPIASLRPCPRGFISPLPTAVALEGVGAAPEPLCSSCDGRGSWARAAELGGPQRAPASPRLQLHGCRAAALHGPIIAAAPEFGRRRSLFSPITAAAAALEFGCCCPTSL
ncbi:uncharacterized protein LOC132494128 [Mesoplodon densirostris]|uniref:uncharacterized protein LOC132494128 n=1 Tax=Mesoplodon densirostris TaxID=48708 RepID=UPI0028DB451F|nr:uncharacterized protein LOC132494128 [Mesoplodon densirostris]